MKDIQNIDIQNIIDKFPNISKEDMYKRWEEYKKIIENEFETSNHCTTLPENPTISIDEANVY